MVLLFEPISLSPNFWVCGYITVFTFTKNRNELKLVGNLCGKEKPGPSFLLHSGLPKIGKSSSLNWPLKICYCIPSFILFVLFFLAVLDLFYRIAEQYFVFIFTVVNHFGLFMIVAYKYLNTVLGKFSGLHKFLTVDDVLEVRIWEIISSVKNNIPSLYLETSRGRNYFLLCSPGSQFLVYSKKMLSFRSGFQPGPKLL